MSIEQQNELIARFLEFTQKSYTPTSEPMWCDNKQGLPVGELKFHKSWDWLMPVLDKIEGLGYDTCITTIKGEQRFQIWKQSNWRDDTNIIIDDDFGGRSKIQTTYDSVVSFIQYYNDKIL